MKTREERIQAIKDQQAKLAARLEKLERPVEKLVQPKTVKAENPKIKGLYLDGYSFNAREEKVEWKGTLTGICWISENPVMKGQTLAHLVTKNHRLFPVNLSRFTGKMGGWNYENGQCLGRA